MTRRRILVPISVLLLAASYGALAQDDAQKSAESWLALIDRQNYAQSWTEASSYFRGRVTQEQWTAMVKGVREPIGAVKSRKVSKLATRTSLPGAPDGEYTVIQFQSSFQNKANAVETLTLMKDNGAWRSAGYFMK